MKEKTDLEAIRKTTQLLIEHYYISYSYGEIEKLPPQELVKSIKNQWLLAWFKYCSPCMNKKDFSEVLGYLWSSVDGATSDPNVSTADTIEWFRQADPKYLMSEDDYKVWESLPDMVTVYRGACTSMGTKIVKNAPSWTLDEKTARHFQRRLVIPGRSVGHLFKAVVPKKYCLAYLNDRKEQTIILNAKSTAVKNRIELIDVYGDKVEEKE
jgi:hypothetical protein